ncbi:uncharacterized protein CEXT_319021 [Caerostris extrusa]|uniref:Ig-like domain-containing protein n=1 Tax=Caerostris extrusa TaxID=172846 RepID=A0AAV4WJX9_CAEEX|nr:uncharacterized protein CEXT_319021 [Caerostris extrusa]
MNTLTWRDTLGDMIEYGITIGFRLVCCPNQAATLSILKNVELNSAGTYKCQVSTDAPTYSCVQAVKEMNVIKFQAGEGSYDFGDNVTLICTSAKSKPAAKLRWLVNDELVEDNKTIDHGVIISRDNLEVTSKTLSLPVSEALLSNGKVAIKCEASFYDRLTMNSKDITILDLNGASKYIGHISLLLISIFINLCSGLRNISVAHLRPLGRLFGFQDQTFQKEDTLSRFGIIFATFKMMRFGYSSLKSPIFVLFKP